MDLGPIIRIIENVPATLPAERAPTPTSPNAAPAKEPTAVRRSRLTGSDDVDE
jgi:hypothetical protein